MEISTQDAEIPMPISSVYGGVHGHGHTHQGHMTHHHHNHNHYHHTQEPPSSPTLSQDHNINPSSSSTQRPSNNHPNETAALDLEDQQEVPYNHRDGNARTSSSLLTTPPTTTKKMIKFRECQKNHAAAMGGNATDGCGEFMPNGEEGSLEALTCSACNCHRNFHRKEIEGEHSQQIYLSTPHPHPHHMLSNRGRKVILASGGGGGQGFLGYPTGVSVGGGALIPVSRAVPINVPYQMGPSKAGHSDHSDDHDRGMIVRPLDHHHHHHHHEQMAMKKRFRTKFSQEQKEKMLEFAEKVGWKIQKQEEAVVQQFCQEVGVKRRVLKVWMHNNKHTFTKKNESPNTNDSSLQFN